MSEKTTGQGQDTPKAKNVVESTKNSKGSKRKKRTVILIIVCVIVAIIIALLVFACSNGWLDPNSQKGHYSGKTEEEIVADLNRQVEEGMMNVSISSKIKFPNGSENDGVANIENIEANHLDQKYRIVLKDTDETVYESGAIKPGYYIETIQLNRYLEPGDYQAYAIVDGYTQDTHQLQGTLAGEITLIIS